VEEVLSSITDMNVIRLRYFNACGRNVEAGLYEEHDPETHLVPLLARNKTATIYGTDWATRDGTCIRDYVHVMDICKAHLLAYEYMDNKYISVNDAINVGCGEGYTVREVVDRANTIIHNGEMIVRTTGRRDGDVAYLVANTDKIKNLLDFTPQFNLDDIMESMK
jgi:UDP-glucose 4-epimerase